MKWRRAYIREATSLVAVQHYNHFLLLQVIISISLLVLATCVHITLLFYRHLQHGEAG